MNHDRIEGRWQQLQGLLTERWGRLIDDAAVIARARQARQAGSIQQRYGVARAEAQRQAPAWHRGSFGRWFAHDNG